MASGKIHDRSILLTTPLALYAQHSLSLHPAFAALYLFSGLYLSPDIDTKSVVLKRWGFLKFIWFPYQRLFPHRGSFFNRNFFTHFPVVGTFLRIGYIILPLCIALLSSGFNRWNGLVEFLAILCVATESSSFIHLLLDIIYTKR